MVDEPEVQSSCPAFGKEFDAGTKECQNCDEEYPDEYAACKKQCEPEPQAEDGDLSGDGGDGVAEPEEGEPEVEDAPSPAAEPETEEPVEPDEPEPEPEPELEQEPVEEEQEQEEQAEPEPVEKQVAQRPAAKKREQKAEKPPSPETKPLRRPKLRIAPPVGSRAALMAELLLDGKVRTENSLVQEIQERRPDVSQAGTYFEVNRRIPLLIRLGALIAVGEDGFMLNPKLKD